MNIKNKIVAALTLAVLVVPGISMAQTMSVAQLQAEIASLTAQINQLDAQLATAGGTATWCYTFNNNLSIGMSGAAVTALQTALQKDGESVTVTDTFDDQTASAVTAFQEKYQSQILAPYGLSYGTGYAGKSTRAELNSLFGCTGSNPVTPPIVVNPIVPTSSSPIAACPMLVPYCPYGGHSVVENNGCSETVCNPAPAAPSTIYPAGCTSFSGYSSVNGQSCGCISSSGYSSTDGSSCVPATAATSPVSVTVTSPTAGQTFADGSTLNIQWTPASTGVAMIVLQPTSGGSWYQLYGEKVDGDPVNYSGSYSANLTGVPAGSYSLKLFADNQGNTLLGQVSPLTISATQTITVLTPNGGTLTSGTTYNITYTSSYPTNDEPETGVALYQGNTLIGYPVTTSAGTDDLSWNVGQYTVNGSGATQIAPAGSNYFIQVYMAGGAKGMSSAPFSIVAPNPTIDSFSVNANQQFSLSAHNYSTITFQAQCGSFVDVVRSPDGTSVSYPTGSASLCNAPQYYSKSNTNADPNTPPIVNEPLILWNAQGVLDGSTSFVGNPAGSNNNGSATLTVNVCNTSGVCVQSSAGFPIYAKACLAPGTTISMADGSYKDIENVKVGDVVKSFSGNETVTKVVQREDPIITINGTLKAAPDEVVYLANGKKEATSQLKIGDQLLRESGQAVTVATIVQSNELAKTYDLALKNGNTFFADGYLVQALSASE